MGSRAACVFDAKATIVNGNQAVLYLWYDNEYGYSCQVYRVLEQMGGIRYQTYPAKGRIRCNFGRSPGLASAGQVE